MKFDGSFCMGLLGFGLRLTTPTLQARHRFGLRIVYLLRGRFKVLTASGMQGLCAQFGKAFEVLAAGGRTTVNMST